MNEAETRAEHIDPALKAAGWGVVEGNSMIELKQIIGRCTRLRIGSVFSVASCKNPLPREILQDLMPGKDPL